jgi:hypothetical protein
MHSPTGKVSVDGLRTTLEQSFEATGLFQAREYGDSYEAYSAIMQQMAQAEVTLVEKFRVLISQESKCTLSLGRQRTGARTALGFQS